MKKGIDIHHYERRLKGAIRQAEEANITKRNKEIILKFRGDLVLEGISKPRLMKYLKIIAQIVKKDFDKLTLDEIKAFVMKIQEREDYSPWTKQAYKVIFRRMFNGEL